MATYVHSIDPYLVQFSDSFGIYWYGFAYLLAFFTGYLVLRMLARRGFGELKEEQVADFIVGTAIFGVVIGGRLGYALFYNFDAVRHDPLSLVRLWEGGMSSHGGMLGVLFFLLYYARRHRLSWPGLGDNLVVGVPLGLFFGRVANFINGELYGRLADVPWAIKFPKELYQLPNETVAEALRAATRIQPEWHTIHAVVSAAPYHEELRRAIEPFLNARHPSQLYAAFLEGLVLFAITLGARLAVRGRKGFVTGVFFVSYSLLRIGGEFFREPDAALTLGLTRGQFLSVFIFLIGCGFLLHAARAPRAEQGSR